jgi:hypothetical protein
VRASESTKAIQWTTSKADLDFHCINIENGGVYGACSTCTQIDKYRSLVREAEIKVLMRVDMTAQSISYKIFSIDSSAVAAADGTHAHAGTGTAKVLEQIDAICVFKDVGGGLPPGGTLTPFVGFGCNKNEVMYGADIPEDGMAMYWESSFSGDPEDGISGATPPLE